MVRSKSISDHVIDIISYIIVTVMAISCILPILNTVAISFSDKSAAQAGIVNFWPVDFTLSSYRELLRDDLFFTSFRNSVFRVIVGGLINLVLTVLMAYPLSKTNVISRSETCTCGFLYLPCSSTVV